MELEQLDMSLRIGRKDFLKEETICGYKVSAKMKAVFRHQLDMLEIVQDICRRHGLHYLMCGGSLLGAVRHKGYIPWDDDIDISMLRPDYDRFVEIANRELKEPYFLQTALSEPNRYIRFAKLRNSQTTAISADLTDEMHDSHQGIFIDIFPIDGVPDDPGEYRRQIRRLDFVTSIDAYAHMRRRPKGLRVIKKILLKILFRLAGAKRIYEWRENILRKFSVDACQNSGQISFFGLNPCTNIPVKYFRDAIEVPFEYLMVRIPRDYDYVLTRQYGEWRKIVRGGQYHNGMYFDPDLPYKEAFLKGL